MTKIIAQKKNVKVGDMLSIPVSGELCSIAQVLKKKRILYLSIYPTLLPFSLINIENVVSEAPVLAGWTADAKIYHGSWKIVGWLEPTYSDNLKRNYKVLFDGKVWVEDCEGKLLHAASESEIEDLFNRSSYSPARFERAIRAYHKLEQWDPEFDDLLLKF